MKYSTSHGFHGSGDAAVAAIEEALFPNGFRLVESAGGIQRYAGRGMQSSRRPAVCGATKIDLRVGGGQLRLDAELGGVRRMAIFVCVFPLALWGGISLAPLVVPGGETEGVGTAALVGAGLWLILGPLMAWGMRRRTVTALGDLLESAAAVAARSSE